MMSQPRVLLCQLSIRTSKAGKAYYSGWLGASQLLGFPGEVNRFGEQTIDLFLQKKEQAEERPQTERLAGEGSAATVLRGRA